MKILLVLITVTILISCNKQKFGIPEEFIGKPHEYIKITGYGDNWITTENNHHKLWLPQSGQFGFKQYFEFESGECEKYLKKIDEERVFTIMRSVNYSMRSELDGRHDTLFKHAKLQCIAYHGVDQSCEEKVLKNAHNIIEDADKNDPIHGAVNATLSLLKKTSDCEIRIETGKERIFSLRESRKL